MYEKFVRKSSKSDLQKSPSSCGSSKICQSQSIKGSWRRLSFHQSFFGHLPAKLSSTMDVAYNVESSVAGFLANFSAPASSSSPPVQLFRSSTGPVVTGSSSSTSSPVMVEASSTGTAPVDVPSLPATTERVSSHLLEAGQQRLAKTLEEATKAFKEASRPSVVIVNQLPPASPPSVAWHQDPDLPAVGAAVCFLILAILVGGCLWMRQYRPDAWKRVKAGAGQLFRWIALPLSWVLERGAGLLRFLHASSSPASTNQVSKTEVLIYIYICVASYSIV
jgi:hypothetical protein